MSPTASTAPAEGKAPATAEAVADEANSPDEERIGAQKTVTSPRLLRQHGRFGDIAHAFAHDPLMQCRTVMSRWHWMPRRQGRDTAAAEVEYMTVQLFWLSLNCQAQEHPC